MSTYRQLLLSTGGGVISGSQQDEQNDCATIAIGLGGTGVACLSNLKKQIYSRLQPDDPEASVPQYSHIKFLAVDSDKSSLNADGAFNSLDEATEYFPISSGDINGLLSQTKILANAPECNWLKTENREKGQRGLSILSATAGAGGVRQIGRLLLIEKSAEFVSKIQQIVTDATRGLPGNAELIVHIFTGIGGGTGSGTFLDVCYLVQEALDRLALKGKALTCGYFFLPDVNLSNTSIEEGSPVSKFIKANGFAAMKEIDYCMNFENNHGCWDQEYKGFHIGPVQDTPVKICHLVSAHDIKGTTLQNGFGYAMNVVSDFIMQFLVKPSPLQATNQVLTMTSHISNYFKVMSIVNKTAGASYQYCLLGASNAIVPMKEIATYLASKLFEEMAKGSRRKPTDQEVAVFAENNGLTYQLLQQAILSDTNYRMPAIDLDYKQFMNMTEEDLALPDEIILPETIMKPYRDRFQSSMVNQLATNYHAMTNPWSLDEIKKSQVSASKVIATFFALRNLVIDPEFGPFYAADVLNGAQTTNLVNHLRGVQKQVDNDLTSVRGDLTLRIQAVKKNRGEFLHGGFLANKKKSFEEFIMSVAAYFTTDSYIKVLEQMQALLPVMIRQFTSLYDEHFKIYQTVNRNLMDTFHENYQTLSTASLSEAIADPFVLPLMEISEMKESLDSAVASMNMDAQAQNFHSFLFDKPQIWNTEDEHQISKEVSKYLVGVFGDYTGKTLTDYLEIRFNTTEPGKLQNHVYTEILQPLKDKAEALFWKGSGFSIAESQTLGYVSVPATASVILAASAKLVKVERSLTECPSKMNDRIFFLKCLCGVPMFAYNGINEYGKEYRNDKTVGKHLYELTDRDDRDWRNLPDLQPYSTVNDPEQELKERAANYEKAIERGIVRQNPDASSEYQIVVWPSIEQLVQDVEKAIASGKFDKMKNAKDEVNTFRSSRKDERIVSITNDGAFGHEEKVRKDHVIASKEMSDTICEELAKEDKLDELLTNLDAAIVGLGTSMQEKDNFFNALYSGVITVNIPKLTYNEEKFGIVKEAVLSDPTMEPAGKLVPLFQAYLTFKGMSAEEKGKLNSLTENRLNDVSKYKDAMQTSCDKLLETFSDRYLGLMQQQAQKLPDNTAEIEDLLLEFRQGIENFKVMYGLV